MIHTLVYFLLLPFLVHCLQSGNIERNRATNRRQAVVSIVGVTTCLLPSSQSVAQTNNDGESSSRSIPNETVVMKGRVTLGTDATINTDQSTSALYLTCRPDKPDNVPSAILNGSRGKSPPVLAARIANPTFPLDFELSSPRDLTVEGAGGETSLEFSKFWWNRDDLIVSARWDSDGVAATRNPDDLVGRGFFKQGEENIVEVELSGRGAFGKFATKKS